MVKVIFYNLLRSKYQIEDILVNSNNIYDIIKEILSKVPTMKESDFKNVVVFKQGKLIHKGLFDQIINNGEEIIMTHFVGGG